jgi:cytochrome P450
MIILIINRTDLDGAVVHADISEQEISAFFAADPEAIAWPYPMYARWQAGTGVVRWAGGPATLLTRHRDVKAVMAGTYPISNNGYRHGRLAEGTLARLPAEYHDAFFRIMNFASLWMSRADGETHTRLRRISSRAFTARRIEQLRASIQGHVDALVADLIASPTADVKTQLANKLPVRVIVDLIGVPQSDRDMIWEWSEAIAALFSLDQHKLRRADEAIDGFQAYLRDMIAKLRATGEGPELARTLLQGHATDVLSEDELIATYLLILFGGTETTTNLLGNCFLALQRHRDQWNRLVAEPSLVRAAVEESMRYDSPHHMLFRYALDDFTIGTERIEAGDTIILLMGAANRDPEVFDEPDRFDIDRPNRAEHLSFAYGPHFCLGAALARLEGELMINTLVTRFPNARLLTDDIRYGGSTMLRAIQNLPTDLGTPAGGS